MNDLEELVAAAADGDERAWQQLWITVEPVLERMIARPRFLGRLGMREDDRRNIVVAIMARLRANDAARLRGYVEARSASPGLVFLGWLAVVAKRVGIDYLRTHPEYLRRCADEPDRWVEVDELPPASRIGGERPPVTMQTTARRVMECAATELDGSQRDALQLWTEGTSFGSIARRLDLAGATAAERNVRAALGRLRRKLRVA